MSVSRRILLIWGMIWLFLWLLPGMYLGPRVEEIFKAQPGYFLFHLRGTHSHALGLSFLVLIMGLVQPLLGLSERAKSFVAVALCFGTLLMPVGIVLEVAHKGAGMALAVIGGILITIPTLVYLIGVIRYQHPHEGVLGNSKQAE